jgi:ribosomal protein S18 acetylase RimI-like enzyme
MTLIRFYTDTDYEWVIETLKEGNLYDEVREDRKNLQNKILRDSESILVVEENNQIIGCVFIVEDWRNAFIRRLCVKEKYRKNWIGAMLMDKAENIIKNRWIKESSIFVRTENESLKEWYKKRSYTETSDFTFMYKKLDDHK